MMVWEIQVGPFFSAWWIKMQGLMKSMLTVAQAVAPFGTRYSNPVRAWELLVISKFTSIDVGKLCREPVL